MERQTKIVDFVETSAKEDSSLYSSSHLLSFSESGKKFVIFRNTFEKDVFEIQRNN